MKFCKKKNSDGTFSILINPNILISDDVDQIENKFKYIKIKKFINGNNICPLIILENQDEIFLDYLIYKIEKICGEFSNEKLSLDYLLKKIDNDFLKEMDEIIIKKLKGDLAEIYFLHRMERHNIHWNKLFQITDTEDYDMSFKNKKIEIKALNTKTKQIIISYKQLVNNNNVIFFAVEIKNQSGGLNIINLLKKLSITTQIINNKIIFWEENYSKYKTQIDSYTINIDDDKIIKLNEEMIPKINQQETKYIIDGELKVFIPDLLDDFDNWLQKNILLK